MGVEVGVGTGIGVGVGVGIAVVVVVVAAGVVVVVAEVVAVVAAAAAAVSVVGRCPLREMIMMRMLMMTVMMIMMMDAFRHIWDWVGEGGGHPEQSPEEPLDSVFTVPSRCRTILHSHHSYFCTLRTRP